MIFKIVVLLGMSMLASLGSYYLKKCTLSENPIITMLKRPAFYLGGMLYIASALLNFYLLKVLPYSVVVPLGSITYIWTLFLSSRLLKESITRRKATGIFLILTGVLLIAVGM